MRKLAFYGESDDLVYVDVNDKCIEEVGSYEKATVFRVVDADGQGMFVVVEYAVRNVAPCWMVGVMPLDEDVTLPDWNMNFALGGRGYSTMLTIEGPDSLEYELTVV